MSVIPERLAAALADRYRLERELGQGGMATVYLAEDLKHDRLVAIKVLKPDLAAVLGAERFITEIKTTAALSHPHILPLFDSGEAGGFLYYVMPYIEGETIREKLNRETQFGIDEAIQITTEVADALDYAHRHGVIHRDIKPENILLHDGRPMVMDFGIALAVSAAAGGRMTETGLSLGTPHYMSPEQATADKQITGRSDIYSLASVCYEMLAGEPPHGGGSAQAIIMKIIAESARPVSELRKSVPPHVTAALAKALEKVPADRFDSAKAFAEALHNAAFTAPGSVAMMAASRATDWRARAAVPALALALALLLTTAWLLGRPEAALEVRTYRVQLAPGQEIGPSPWPVLAVSPDGRLLAYVGPGGAIHLRAQDRLDATVLAGTEGGYNLSFSPDGSRIAYMYGTPGQAELRVVPVTGGPPTTISREFVGGPGAAWGHDGYIYYDHPGVGALRRVPATGGPSEFISALDSASGELQHIWPDPLPNGRGVLITLDRSGPGAAYASDNEIGVLDLRTGSHRALARGVLARYMPPGFLVYVTVEGVLLAAPFDQDRMEVTGPAIPVREGVGVRATGSSGGDFAVSASGTLWYLTGGVLERQGIFRVDERGNFLPLDTSWAGVFRHATVSPDGSRLALTVLDPQAGEQVWVRRMDRPGSQATRLTFEGNSLSPAWHPNGRDLAMTTRVGGGSEIWSAPADGSMVPQRLWADGTWLESPRWTPDGQWLLFERRTGTGRDILGLRPGRDTAPVPLLVSPAAETFASVSPDGRWLLHEVMADNVPQVFVRPFPNTGTALYQVSAEGIGTRPRWAPDGRAIYYRGVQRTIVRVEVRPGPAFELGEARQLFPLQGIAEWEPLPDGSGLIVLREGGQGPGSDLVVVENFAAELAATLAGPRP